MSIKMHQDHFSIMETVLSIQHESKRDIHRLYHKRSISIERYRWDLLHSCQFPGYGSGTKFICAVLYPAGLNDKHIYTALKRIIPDYEEASPEALPPKEFTT